MARFKGVVVRLTRERIERIAASYTENPKIKNLYTDIDGKMTPPKWLVMVALNLGPDDLISYDAVDLLNQLGYRTYANEEFESQKLHRIKYRPLYTR